MSKIAIVYWSGTGNTEAMAKLVARGAASLGVEADVMTPEGFDSTKIGEYTAIGFGCPSMGAEQLEESEFEPMFQEVKGSLDGKAIVLFGSYGWGDGEWMRDWADECECLGCRLLIEPVIVSGSPEGDVKESCMALGLALAKE